MTNTIETLRTFALSHNEVQFAHLCTAAINGEAWAMWRVENAIRRDGMGGIVLNGSVLDAIRSTDTTRPDGAVARSFVP